MKPPPPPSTDYMNSRSIVPYYKIKVESEKLLSKLRFRVKCSLSEVVVNIFTLNKIANYQCNNLSKITRAGSKKMSSAFAESPVIPNERLGLNIVSDAMGALDNDIITNVQNLYQNRRRE